MKTERKSAAQEIPYMQQSLLQDDRQPGHPIIPVVFIKGELYSSKNSRRIFCNSLGRRFITKSARAKGQELTLHAQLIAQRSAWWEMVRTLTGDSSAPLRVRFYIIRSSHRRFDYINIVQGLLDAMVKAKYIPDDDADHIIPSFARYGVDKDHPCAIITLERIDDATERTDHR